ncbi:MAG: iron ABC transporter permease [Negativicutes bacterium]|jgi:iron complex transport system permease protein
MMFKTKFLTLLFLLAAVFVFSIALGAVFVPPLAIIKVILSHFAIVGIPPANDEFDAIIWFVRLPRALTAALAGAALAAAGAFMQGIFRNPMADPGIIGVSSGASLGAVICIALNLSALNIMFMPLTAALGALLASMAVITIARQGNKLPPLRLLLSGVATSMFFGALTYIVLMNIAGDKVKQFMFWTTGNFNTAVWSNVWIVLIPTLLLLLLAYPYLRDLNLLLAGDAQARTLGINPNKTRMLFMLLASCIAASAVCVGGNISFVGLIVPHIARYFTGSDFRRVIPFAAIGGAIMLLLCDLLARTLFNDLSVGIVTSLIGVPYFIALLRRA